MFGIGVCIARRDQASSSWTLTTDQGRWSRNSYSSSSTEPAQCCTLSETMLNDDTWVDTPTFVSTRCRVPTYIFESRDSGLVNHQSGERLRLAELESLILHQAALNPHASPRLSSFMKVKRKKVKVGFFYSATYARLSPRKHLPDGAARARKQTSDYSLLLSLSTSKGWKAE